MSEEKIVLETTEEKSEVVSKNFIENAIDKDLAEATLEDLELMGWQELSW